VLKSLCAFFLIPLTLNGVDLAWGASSSGDAQGYHVFWGFQSHSYDFIQDAGNSLTNRITGLEAGVTYFFAVTAYKDGVESDFSQEITFTQPFTTNSVLTVDHSDKPVGPWTNQVTVTNVAGWQGFYRVNLTFHTNQ